jgi:hypothetical protein
MLDSAFEPRGETMLHTSEYDDGRGRYLDQLKLGLRVPVGFRDVVKRAAEAERVSALRVRPPGH